VEKGLAQVGEQCRVDSKFVKEREIFNKETPDIKFKAKLCGGHYNQWLSVNRPQELEAAKSKRMEKNAEQRAAAVETHDKLVEESEKKPETYGINASVIDAMGLNKPCDLAEELAVYKALPMGDGQENYAEKMEFARWLSTPDVKKTPKTILEAAAILGITVQTAEIWRRSPDVATFRKNDAVGWLRNAFPYIVYKTIDGCDRSDPRFFKIYKELLEAAEEKAPKNKFPQLPAKMVEQAEVRNAESGRVQMHGSLNKAEKAIVFGAVRDGDTEVAQ